MNANMPNTSVLIGFYLVKIPAFRDFGRTGIFFLLAEYPVINPVSRCFWTRAYPENMRRIL
jgi:hypothetical protein